MRLDARPPTETRRDDLDRGARRVADAPQRAGEAEAEYSTGPGREHGGHPPRRPGSRAMADGVDAAMDGMKQPARDAVLDRALTEPEVEQLRPSDHAVLAVGQDGQLAIRSRYRFAPYLGAE